MSRLINIMQLGKQKPLPLATIINNKDYKVEEDNGNVWLSIPSFDEPNQLKLFIDKEDNDNVIQVQAFLGRHGLSILRNMCLDFNISFILDDVEDEFIFTHLEEGKDEVEVETKDIENMINDSLDFLELKYDFEKNKVFEK